MGAEGTERDEVLDEIEEALDAGEPDRALELCEELLEEDPDDPDALVYRGDALQDVGELPEALRSYQRALALNPDWDEADVRLAGVMCELGRLPEARVQAEHALARAPDRPDVHYWLAIIHEFEGDEVGAERHYRQAHKLDPEQPMPTRVSDKEFDRLAQEALEQIAPQFGPYLDNVLISVRDFPSAETATEGDPPLGMLILGYFEGTPRDERLVSDASTHWPCHIFLYKKNLERFCSSRAMLRQEIATTLRHELAHFFGKDEDEVDEMGLA